MLATKIFPETFRSFQQMVNRNIMVDRKVLKHTINPLTQFHVANLYSISNLISLQLAELQKDHVINLIDSYNFKQRIFNSGVNRKIASEISYDEQKYIFKLKFNYQIHKSTSLLQSIQQIKNHQLQIKEQLQNQLFQNLEVSININNCESQKIDHPSLRQTLYFHELKDMQKYVTFKPVAKTPLFLEEMNRKKMEVMVLDQDNPYGLPEKAPPLIFNVEIGGKVYFKIKSTYQQTIITQIGSLKKVSSKGELRTRKIFKMSGMNVPRGVQEMLYNSVMSELLMINEDQLLKMHKLAYIGGKIQTINTLMQVHEMMAMDNEKIFNKIVTFV